MEQLQTLGAQCPECGSPDIVEDGDMGEFICNNCGLVILDDTIDFAPEWRAFTLEENEQRRRVGPPMDYSHYDKGLSTSIDRIDRDAFGRKLPLSTRLQMWRLRKWQIRSRVHSSINRNLAQAMTELQRLTEKLNVPPTVQKTAALFYRRALKKDLVRGRSIASIVCAALYAACRFTETPKSLIEVADASLRSRKEISRSYRLLVRELGIKMPTPDPLRYLNRIAEKAGITSDVQSLAFDIINEAKRRNITAGKDPRGVAAAALYIASRCTNKQVTQKRVAKAANISEVTLRNRQNELTERLAEPPITYYRRLRFQHRFSTMDVGEETEHLQCSSG